MKKVFGVLFFILTVTSGLSAWTWKNYSKAVNDYMKSPSEETSIALMEMYESIISVPEEKFIGPGVFADFGYFLAIEGNREDAVKMFKKEIQLFPESEVFVAKLIEEVTGEPYEMKYVSSENTVHPGLEFLPVNEGTDSEPDGLNDNSVTGEDDEN